MNELIEGYLRTRGVRYFRGHHDDEYFFLVDVVLEGRRKRLHLHLQGEGCDVVALSIAPDRYYPTSARAQLADVAARWKAGEPSAEVVIHDSSDPRLVGVSAHYRAGSAELARAVDHAIAAAIDLFAEMKDVATSAPHRNGLLRDAG